MATLLPFFLVVLVVLLFLIVLVLVLVLVLLLIVCVAFAFVGVLFGGGNERGGGALRALLAPRALPEAERHAKAPRPKGRRSSISVSISGGIVAASHSFRRFLFQSFAIFILVVVVVVVVVVRVSGGGECDGVAQRRVGAERRDGLVLAHGRHHQR